MSRPITSFMADVVASKLGVQLLSYLSLFLCVWTERHWVTGREKEKEKRERKKKKKNCI